MTPKGADPDAEVLAVLAINDTVGGSAYLQRYPEAIRIRTLPTRETALHWVVMKRSESAARFLLERGADVNAIDASGGTPLLYAVQNRDDGIVDLLLRSGADVNLKNQLGETPILFAIEQGRPALCRALLAAGAQVEAIAWGGDAVLHRALTSRTEELTELAHKGAPSAVGPLAPASLSKRLWLLVFCLAVAVALYGATVFFWPLTACQYWPVGDLGEGRCLGVVAHAGQRSRCRVVEALLYEIKHNKSDVVISGALDGLASAGACIDVAFLLRQLPSGTPPGVYRRVATAFEACQAARPYSENLLVRERSTPIFDQGELRRIANGSRCN